MHQNVSEVTRVRGTDVPSKMALVSMHSSLEIENSTEGPPLGKSDLVLVLDYIVKQEVLKNNIST